MQFNPDNPIVKLCAQGMQQEATGQPGEALALFMQAWQQAESDMDKFVAAHYVARHQPTVADKLAWDETALRHALRITGNGMEATYPSLYLNIAKCYEDMHQPQQAKAHYLQALSFARHLPDDGYGNMIKSGIEKGLERVEEAIK